MQNISFNLPELLYGVVSGIIAVIFWVVRKVSTNEKQIAIVTNDLKNAAENRERQNEQTKESFKELKDEMSELKNDIKTLILQNSRN